MSVTSLKLAGSVYSQNGFEYRALTKSNRFSKFLVVRAIKRPKVLENQPFLERRKAVPDSETKNG